MTLNFYGGDLTRLRVWMDRERETNGGNLGVFHDSEGWLTFTYNMFEK